MRNNAPINHFPPTLFSPNHSPIYGEAHLFSAQCLRQWEGGRLGEPFWPVKGRASVPGLHQALEFNATGIGSAPVFGNQPGRVGRATRKEWGNLTDARANTHQSELDAALRYQGVRHFILAAWKDSRHLLQTSSWG